MPQIYVEKIGENWYYSSETVNAIDTIYKEVFPWYVEKLQNIIPDYGHKKIVGVELWQFIGIVLLFIITLLVFFLTKKISFSLIRRAQKFITKNTKLY